MNEHQCWMVNCFMHVKFYVKKFRRTLQVLCEVVKHASKSGRDAASQSYASVTVDYVIQCNIASLIMSAGCVHGFSNAYPPLFV